MEQVLKDSRIILQIMELFTCGIVVLIYSLNLHQLGGIVESPPALLVSAIRKKRPIVPPHTRPAVIIEKDKNNKLLP